VTAAGCAILDGQNRTSGIFSRTRRRVFVFPLATTDGTRDFCRAGYDGASASPDFANGAITAAFSYAAGSFGRGGGDEGGATTCGLGECPGEQLMAGPLEYLTPTRSYFQAGPGVAHVDGYSWIATWSGTAAGESAAMYWAGRHVQTGNPLYAVPGVMASLWTPDTALQTAFTLGTAGGGSVGYKFGREITFGRNARVALFGNRTGHRFGELPHYHRRGIDPLTGQTLPGQGIGRHRPWELKSTDQTWWDRF